MFEVHTGKEEGGEEALGAGEWRGFFGENCVIWKKCKDANIFGHDSNTTQMFFEWCRDENRSDKSGLWGVIILMLFE